jgi:hypothetical protein
MDTQDGLFQNFPHQGTLNGLTGLHFTARKFQQATLMNVIGPPGNQHPSTPADNANRDMNDLRGQVTRHNQVRYSALMVT